MPRLGSTGKGNEKVTMGGPDSSNEVASPPDLGQIPAFDETDSVRILPKAWEIVPNLFRLPPEDNALISFLGGVTGRGSTTPATGDAAAGFPCRQQEEPIRRHW